MAVKSILTRLSCIMQDLIIMARHRFVESLSKILRRKMFGLKGIIIVFKSLSRVVLHLFFIVNDSLHFKHTTISFFCFNSVLWRGIR